MNGEGVPNGLSELESCILSLVNRYAKVPDQMVRYEQGSLKNLSASLGLGDLDFLTDTQYLILILCYWYTKRKNQRARNSFHQRGYAMDYASIAND